MTEVASKVMGFGKPFVAPFDSLTSKRQKTCSKYNPNTAGTTSATIGGSFLEVTMYIVKTAMGEENKLALGTAGGKYICEYQSATGKTDIVVYDPISGEVRGSVYNQDNATADKYVFSKLGRNGNAVIASIFPIFLTDDEFSQDYENFYKEAEAGFPDLFAAAKLIARMSDNVYYRIKDPNCSAHVKIKLDNEELPFIRSNEIRAGGVDPDDIVMGTFGVLSNPTGKTPSASEEELPSYEELIGKYKINPERELTAEEQANVEKNMISDYIVQERDVEICELIQKTTETNVPFRTFTFAGDAGCGKSTTAKAIASFIGQPFVIHTCSVNDEIYDFVGQVMPVNSNGDKAEESDVELLEKISHMEGGLTSDNVAAAIGLPVYEDIVFDPEMAYEELTGEPAVIKNKNYKAGDETFTQGEFKNHVISLWVKKTEETYQRLINASQKNSSVQKYVYTETDFIRAVKNGWVVEIQEPNVIMSEGVLVGLNGLLQEGILTLPTGEVIHRHPDNIIIFTTNIDYNGCRNMNQSVIDRSNALYVMEEPSTEGMTSRAMLLSGNTDFDMVFEMAEIIKDVAETMKKYSIEDGVCGQRSLANWAAAARFMSPYDAFMNCVLSKTSMDEESREALKKRIDESSFRPAKSRLVV